MNIVLIGYRGTGKSTIGKKLAERLRRDFVDTDTLLVERAGKTIKQIFETEGEPGFRDREAAVIAEVANRDNLVIAVGGGAVLRPANVTALKKNGRLIWLQANATVLHARITADPATAANRPNLLAGGGGGAAEIEILLAARTPLYKAAADATLDVTNLSVEQAVEALNHIALALAEIEAR
ncbi:MAG: shikimate kinase [Phycisphaerales bacterium]|nr:shikimate kinase [Phycisphaerales bacterium]